MVSIEQLRKYPIFAGLTDDELAGVPPILKRRAFADGAYIYYPGNPGLQSYLVESGLVRLFLSTTEGQELTLKLIKPQQAFGLPLLDDEQTRLHGAMAHQPTVLYTITRQDILQLMNRSTQFMCNIYKILAADARKLLLHLRSMATLNLNSRLAAMLLRLAKRDAGDQYRVEMPLNQEQFASWLGASRGRLNQAIHKFEDMGMIRIYGSAIVILDYPGLERMTEDQTIEEV